MKPSKIFFFLMPVAFANFGRRAPDLNHKPADKGVLLAYTGKLGATDIGIHIEIDSLVGVRYDVVFENGNNVMSHNALFYKYSDPQKTVLYNFLTHKSSTHYCCGSASGESKVEAVGTDVIGNYNCTHVRDLNYNERHATDYWVSTDVPGYSLLLKILNNIAPGYKQMFIDGQIFQWGGLVKMTSTSQGQAVANINLTEANPGMSFPATDFDVPKK